MKFLWWRIIAFGIVLEICYGVFILAVLGSNAAAYEVLGLLGAAVFMMVGGLFVGWKSDRQPGLQGAMVGGTAMIFYLVLFGVFTILGVDMGEAGASEPVPWGLWWLNHGLKVVGGAVGGFIGGAWLNRPNEAIS